MKPIFIKLLCVMLSACAQAPQPATVAPVAPDVQFVRAMIAHHAQAVEMSALARTRTGLETVGLLAERIEVSQRDEIKRMNRWLQARGEAEIGLEHAGHSVSHAGMSGMLRPEDFARLRASSGRDFDRLFLELMIRHHEGALSMVERLAATPGGVQDADLWELASSIDADQRAEIPRMRALLSNVK